MICNTNFYNNECIVSFDPDKVWIEKNNNVDVFCKKTNKTEIKNINKITKLLNKKEITINNKIYTIKIPEIIKWDSKNKILYSRYCNGDNLEFYLRNEKTHKKGVIILNALLKYFISNKIFWIDFAPRNIIIKNNIIYIVDFEKGINRKINYKEYLRFNVLEEYSLFLLNNERIFKIDDVLLEKHEINLKYKLKNIKDKRYVYIANKLGYKNIIYKSDYIYILNKILKIEEPSLINKQFVFPGVELDKIFINNKKEEALKMYSKKIVELIEKDKEK